MRAPWRQAESLYIHRERVLCSPWREGRSEEGDPGVVLLQATWKHEGQGKMFSLISWQYSLAPGYNGPSSDVADFTRE